MTYKFTALAYVVIVFIGFLSYSMYEHVEEIVDRSERYASCITELNVRIMHGRYFLAHAEYSVALDQLNPVVCF